MSEETQIGTPAMSTTLLGITVTPNFGLQPLRGKVSSAEIKRPLVIKGLKVFRSSGIQKSVCSEFSSSVPAKSVPVSLKSGHCGTARSRRFSLRVQLKEKRAQNYRKVKKPVVVDRRKSGNMIRMPLPLKKVTLARRCGPTEPVCLNSNGPMLKILSHADVINILKKCLYLEVPTNKQRLRKPMKRSDEAKASHLPKKQDPGRKKTNRSKLIRRVNQKRLKNPETLENQIALFRRARKLGAAKKWSVNLREIEKRQLLAQSVTLEMKQRQGYQKLKLLPMRPKCTNFPKELETRLNLIRENIFLLYYFLGKEEQVSCRICLERFKAPLTIDDLGRHVLEHSSLPLFTCSLCIKVQAEKHFTSSSDGAMMVQHFLNCHKVTLRLEDKQYNSKMANLTVNHSNSYETVLLTFLEKCFGVVPGVPDPAITRISKSMASMSPDSRRSVNADFDSEVDVDVAEILEEADPKRFAVEDMKDQLMDVNGSRYLKRSSEELGGDVRSQDLASVSFGNSNGLKSRVNNDSVSAGTDGDEADNSQFRKICRRSNFDESITSVLSKSKQLLYDIKILKAKSLKQKKWKQRFKNLPNETIPVNGLKPVRFIQAVQDLATQLCDKKSFHIHCRCCERSIKVDRRTAKESSVPLNTDIVVKNLRFHLYSDIHSSRGRWYKLPTRNLFSCKLCTTFEANSLSLMVRHLTKLCKKKKAKGYYKKLGAPGLMRHVEDRLQENEEYLLSALAELFGSEAAFRAKPDDKRILKMRDPEPEFLSEDEEEPEDEETERFFQNRPTIFLEKISGILRERLKWATHMKCRLCPMIFTKGGRSHVGKVIMLTSSGLAWHAQQHSQLPLFQCLLCDAAYCKWGLRNHVRDKHGRAMDRTTVKDLRRQMEHELIPWVEKCYGTVFDQMETVGSVTTAMSIEKELAKESGPLEFFRLASALYTAAVKNLAEGVKKLVFVCQLCNGNCSCFGHMEYIKDHAILELCRTREEVIRRPLFGCSLCGHELNSRRDMLAHLRENHEKNLGAAYIQNRCVDVEEDLIEVLEECFPLAREIRARKAHATNSGEYQLTLGEMIVNYGPRTAEQFKTFVSDYVTSQEKLRKRNSEKPVLFWSLLAQLFPFSPRNEKLCDAKWQGNKIPSLQCVLCNEQFSLESEHHKLQRKIEQHVIWEVSRRNPPIVGQALFKCDICGWETSRVQGISAHTVHDKEYGIDGKANRKSIFTERLKQAEAQLIRVLGECFPDTRMLAEFESALATASATESLRHEEGGHTFPNTPILAQRKPDNSEENVEIELNIDYVASSAQRRKQKTKSLKNPLQTAAASKRALALNRIQWLSSKVEKTAYERATKKQRIVYTDIPVHEKLPGPTPAYARVGPSAGTRRKQWKNPFLKPAKTVVDVADSTPSASIDWDFGLKPTPVSATKTVVDVTDLNPSASIDWDFGLKPAPVSATATATAVAIPDNINHKITCESTVVSEKNMANTVPQLEDTLEKGVSYSGIAVDSLSDWRRQVGVKGVNGRPKGRNKDWYRKFVAWRPPEQSSYVPPPPPTKVSVKAKKVIFHRIKEADLGAEAAKRIKRAAEKLLLAKYKGQMTLRCRLCQKKFKVASEDSLRTATRRLSPHSLMMHAFHHLATPLFVCLICGYGLTCDELNTGATRVKEHILSAHNKVYSVSTFKDRRGEKKDEVLAILDQCFGDATVPDLKLNMAREDVEKSCPPNRFFKIITDFHDLLRKRKVSPSEKIVLNCQICQRKCSCRTHKEYIGDHVTLHMAENLKQGSKESAMFSCALCGIDSNSRRDLQAHIRNNHGTKLDAVCDHRGSMELESKLIQLLVECFPESEEIVRNTDSSDCDWLQKEREFAKKFWADLEKSVLSATGVFCAKDV